jgi:hypothetical protein
MARVSKPGEIDDVMPREVVHDQQIAGAELDCPIPHPEQGPPVERREQLQRLVPRRTSRVAPGGVVEQLAAERELAVERHLVMTARVELRCDVVRLERRARACRDQIVPGAGDGGRSWRHRDTFYRPPPVAFTDSIQNPQFALRRRCIYPRQNSYLNPS